MMSSITLSDSDNATRSASLIGLVETSTTRQFLHELAAATDELSVIETMVVPSNDYLEIPNVLETLKSCLHRRVYSDRAIYEEQLLESYRRLHDSSTKKQQEFVLIQGPSGSGKTRLATTLRDTLKQDGGICLVGKFDQMQRPEPYSAFVAAFTDFATIIEHDGRLCHFRHSILEAVGEGADALTEMIPALERVIGYQDRTTSSLKNGAEAMNRFVFVFRMFMRAICSPDNPLVFVIDDMHWADPCSLELLTSLVTDTESNGVLFVGTCEDNVALDSPLSTMLRKLDEEHVQMTNVLVCNFSYEEVQQIIEEALCLPSDHCEELADVIYTQTEGNICYIIEFFRWLLEEKLLAFNQDSFRWECRQDEIALSIKHDRVGDFMIDKLEQLTKPVQELMKIASCLGFVVKKDLLRLVADFELTPALEKSMERGMLVYDEKHRSYAFTHDVAQKAAYALINPEDRSHFHLGIGRKVWQRIEECDLNYYVFTIVSQYCFSSETLIEDQTEKVAIAGLCLHAGRKAAKSSTFRTASTYLNFGIRLLGRNCWKEHYRLTLELYNAAAEMELCISNFDGMNALLDAVFDNVRHPPDKQQAYATRIYALAVRDQQNEALETGKIVLSELGEKFPTRFPKAHLVAEMISVKRLLRGKSDEALMRLPLMEDSKRLAAVQILDLMFVSSLFTTPTLLPFVVLKMMKITLQHGSSAWTATAFSSYGMVCCAIDDFDQGFRFGQLALAYLDKFRCREFLPRVYFGVYGEF
jgi:predicted ATPase